MIQIHPLPVSAAPSISMSPSTGVSGTKVTIKGKSFTSYIGDQLSVYLDSEEITRNPFTVSADGTFQVIVFIPSKTSAGIHEISVRNQSGIPLATAQFRVPSMEISLNKWGGPVGTAVTAFCRGFTAGSRISVRYSFTDDEEEVASSTASDIGECTLEFTIPPSSDGFHEIVVVSSSGDVAKTTFNIIPSVAISPGIGAVNDKVAVSGTGFTRLGIVNVSLSGKLITSTDADENGSFNAFFYVPPVKAGTYTLEITDSYYNRNWVDFTVDSEMDVSETAGTIGTKVTVAGTGFESKGIVVIRYDFAVIKSAIVADDGSFSSTFAIPVSDAGKHIISVYDGFNAREAYFTVESEPPPVPKPTSPKMNDLVQAGNSFDWESVFDPSEPVFYTLQIARDPYFIENIIEVDNLSLSRYDLSDESLLLPNRRFTYYYWRVRATDSAGNQGEWSQAVRFQIKPQNTIPTWAKVILIIFGLVLAAFSYFRIRKSVSLLREASPEE